MSPQANEVLEAALQLTEAERFSLAHQILDTLPEELLTAEWHAELERRSDDWEGSVDWEDLKNELRRPQ